MLAHSLIAFELQSNQGTTATSEAFRACDRLRPPLTSLMGSGGFRAIHARALNLAGGKVPWLRGVQLAADGSLAGLEELQQQVEPNDFRQGGAVVLAHLLGLLVAFIGEPLTFRLVREAWPRIPLDGLELVTKGIK